MLIKCIYTDVGNESLPISGTICDWTGNLTAVCPFTLHRQIGVKERPFQPHIFLLYCPPTAYNAPVICPSEQTFTASMSAVNMFSLRTAVCCKARN